MVIYLNRFLKYNFIHFQGDHVGGAANGSRIGSTCLIQPCQHLASKEVVIYADIAGFAYLGGYQVHLNPFVLVLLHETSGAARLLSCQQQG